MEKIFKELKKRTPGETEFHQAVEEVLDSIAPVLDKKPEYRKLKIVERILEPERVVMFRVPWTDDKGEIQVNRGYRVEFNSAIGPYKGGLRFHPSVNLSILKFLGFEQIFKNALTTLPMGGGKGGADFDPKGKSDAEVMRFCQSYMMELQRHIGAETDVPAGDIGVGGREIGYMFGMYKKIRNEFVGVLTGKGREWGGSLIRPEATGYGLVYFVKEMLKVNNHSMKGKTCLVSGSGNVAQYAMEKILDLGGTPVTFSDSSGSIYDAAGIDREKLAYIMDLKNVKRGRVKEYVKKYPSAEFTARGDSEANPIWNHKADLALPCATQNEIGKADAKNLIKNGIILVAEGANMPTSPEAIEEIMKAGLLYAPGKASNAGGVAVSGLEMSQNRLGYSWDSEEVNLKLKNIMKDIHAACLEASKEYSTEGNYMAGANIAGFIKVAESMKAQGVV